MNHHLIELVKKHQQGIPTSICSVCSAQQQVVEAALEYAMERNKPALIESTCNQVNQFGGYSGMKPLDFVRFVRGIAGRRGFPEKSLILGGDHLGPYPWRDHSISHAMDMACCMVRDYVKAGYNKIHLDTSMQIGTDPAYHTEPLDTEIAVERCAELCEAAELAVPASGDKPAYVIGTEVPIPGGTDGHHGPPTVTDTAELERTISLTEKAFRTRGLEAAWNRVIAVVVQPGVEFGDEAIYEYDPEKTRGLYAIRNKYPNLVFEGHSTDFQQADRLRQMTADGIAILKAGPALTFAFREAVFLLNHIEQELYLDDPLVDNARVPQILVQAMKQEPEYWYSYHQGDSRKLKLSLKYSLSDRSRYYWSNQTVQNALQKLFSNLRRVSIPTTLISQYFPNQYWRIRQGSIKSDPAALITDRIKDVLRMYPD